MKTRKKLLIALLSATCLTAGAFGIAACDKKTDTNDTALVGIYNAYVAEANANNQTVLSYEDWLKEKLETVAKPGEQGKPGNDGESAYDVAVKNGFEGTESEWLASLVGASGLTPSIGTNGNWYIGETDTGVKAEGTNGTNGTGISSVVMSSDGKSLVVTYTSGATATVPLPKEVTHVHAYAGEFHVLLEATADNEGLAYQICKANGCDHLELFAYKAPVSGTGSEEDPYVLNADFTETGATQSFKVAAEKTAKGGYDVNDDVYVTFTVATDGKYSLKNTVGASFTVVEGGVSGENGTAYLNAGEVTVAVNTDDTVYPEVIVSLTFEGEVASGSSQDFPMELGNEEVTVKSSAADKNGYVYLKLTVAQGNYKFTSNDSGIELSVIGYEYSWDTCEYEEVEIPVTLGEVVNGVGVSSDSWSPDVVIVKAKLSEGKASATLKATAYFEVGEDMSTAITLAHNTETKSYEGMSNIWFKYEASGSGIKTIAGDNAFNSFTIYDEEGNQLDRMTGMLYPFYFEDATYYIKAEVYDRTFKIRDYDETTDVGLSKYAAVDMELDEATSNTNRYFKFTAEEQGTYVLIGTFNSYSGSYSYTVYTGPTWSEKAELTDGEIELEANQTIYIDTLKVATTVKKLSDVENVEVDYVITVTDNNYLGLEGIKVTVNGVEATTDEDGKATISTVPGKYEVELDFGDDADKYGYTTVTTSKLYTEEVAVSVIVNVQKEYTITVKGSGEAKSGVEVTVWKVIEGDRGSETETQYVQVGEAQTTGADGSVKFTLLSGVNYEVRLANIPEGFSYNNNVSLSNQTLDINLTSDEEVDEEGETIVYTYIYKGWEQYVDGEERYYLYAENNAASYTLLVEGGYIKYLKTTYDDGWLYEETEWVVDGVFTADAEEYWYGDEGETATEIVASEWDTIFVGTTMELIVCSYDGMETKVVFEKVPSNY